MANREVFKKALAFVLKWEGGYANDPDDRGKMTYRGVTQTTYDSYLKQKKLNPKSIATEYVPGTVPKGMNYVHYTLKRNGVLIKNVDVVINITQTEIEEIYYKRYWLAAHCDTMTDKFAALCFNTAVNFGCGIVKATGMTRNEEFLRAAAFKYPNKYIDAVENKYKEFAKYGNQKVFLKGWLNRTSALRQFIATI